jgi:N-acetylglucosamine transport system permease protein
VSLLWKFLYHPTIGLINSMLSGLGLGRFAETWLGDKAFALPSVTAAFIWWALGFYVMLFTAGLASIPGEVREAAELDGARGAVRFWKVTWPMLWSVKRVALTYVVINVMNIFALVFLMTRGGDPDRATETTLTYLYEVGFESSKFGHASAIAVANFTLSMILAGAILLLYRRSPEEGRA